MIQETKTGFKASRVTWSSAVVLCLALVITCAPSPSQTSLPFASQAQNTALSTNAKIKLVTGPDVRTLKGHTTWVMSVAFSPSGQILASGSPDRRVILWDVSTGTLLRTLTFKYPVLSVAFSPDGRILATSGGSSPTFGDIILWDTQTWAQKQSLSDHKNKVFSVAFSPDSKTLASGSQDKTIKLWDVQTGELKRTLTGHTDTVSSVAFSPDGKILASSCYQLSDGTDESVKLWDVETGALKMTLPSYGPPVAFSPDGKTLAAAYKLNSVRLINPQTAKVKQMLEIKDSSIVESIAFSAEGKAIASGWQDSDIRLWDAESGVLKQTLEGHDGLVESVAFSPDGKILASGSDDRTIKLWRLGPGN